MKIVVRAHAVACSLSIVGQNGWGEEGVHSFLLSSTGRRLKNITDGSNNMLREWKREREQFSHPMVLIFQNIFIPDSCNFELSLLCCWYH